MATVATGLVNAIFGSVDSRHATQWREQDLAHREQETQWLNDAIVRAHEWRQADLARALRRDKMTQEHRLCDARAEQLHTVSEQCALLCGFTVAAMSNLNLPARMSEVLLFAYATSATLVCVLLLLAVVNGTMLLLAVTRYAAHSLEPSVQHLGLAEIEHASPFTTWWLQRGEPQQNVISKLMVVGVLLFFVYLGILSWIQFRESIYTPTSISILCLLGLVVWEFRLASRWRYLLRPPKASEAGTRTRTRIRVEDENGSDLQRTSLETLRSARRSRIPSRSAGATSASI